jgi:hypothetical protein
LYGGASGRQGFGTRFLAAARAVVATLLACAAAVIPFGPFGRADRERATPPIEILAPHGTTQSAPCRICFRAGIPAPRLRILIAGEDGRCRVDRVVPMTPADGSIELTNEERTRVGRGAFDAQIVALGRDGELLATSALARFTVGAAR